MKLRPIREKPKSRKKLGLFLIWLIILGFIAGVILAGWGIIRPYLIPHP